MGASAVAEFFINAGTGIAAAFDVTELNPSGVVTFTEESGE